MLSRYVKLLSVLFTFTLIGGCFSKVYPDERLAIDTEFLAIFNSISQKDTFSFRNTTGERKTFVITRVDSVTSNKKGWFVNEKPYKLLVINFKEIGKNTTYLERRNEIFVNKDPATNTNGLCIKFNNFYSCGDTVLPRLNHDTLSLNNKKITKYYLFETSLGLKKPNDVQALYINVPKGFVGFKTSSGEVWVNEVE